MQSYLISQTSLMQVASEESKLVEVSKLQKALESLSSDLNAAKLATANEHTKNMLLQNQLDCSLKDIATLRGSLTEMAELKKGNLYLKV